ncbi:MAG: metal-dependent hydrolase [Myxococcota bacterium]
MADLVTHLASALIPGVALRADRAAALALGAALPDVGGRVPGLFIELLETLGLPHPGVAHVPFGILHQPAGALLTAVVLSFVVPEKDRPWTAGCLAIGVLGHLALDALQDHHGYGYFLLVPFEFSRYELGYIGSESTVPWAPWLALATALLWTVRWGWQRRNRSKQAD